MNQLRALNILQQNITQKKFWSGSGGEMWVRDQAVFDRRLKSLGDTALQRINFKTGMDVVDIGCGSGTTTFDILALVGEKGSVTGVDISRPLLQLATERAEISGLTSARFLNQDVQTKSLATSRFDAAFSRFGVMFFDDPTKAFANINQALKSGSQLAFVCFQSPERNLWASLSQRVFEKRLGIKMYEDKRAPSPFAFQEKSYISTILEAAGFVDIAIEGVEKTVDWYSGISISQAVDNLLRANPVIAEKLTAAEDSSQDVIRAELEASYAEYSSEGNIRFPAAVWIVSAISSSKQDQL